MKLNAKQLRVLKPQAISQRPVAKNNIYIILDNVLDTYNIGSIFRLADAFGVRKIYLCGATSTPPNPRIKKASINTTEVVEWEYKESVVDLVKDLKSKINNLNLSIVAIEQAEGSTLYNKFEYKLPVALIVGHESYGISQEVLKLCDGVVEIPMYGINNSLNVMVSLAIVLSRVVKVV